MTKSKIPYWRTTFGKGEVSAITKAIESEYVSQGPIVAELERQLAEYLEVPYVVATTSGSTALLMSLLASEVKPDDEVIVPNRSWIATAHAPFLLGAKVKLIDVEVDRPIINVRLIEDAITEKTRVIIPVHMCGRSADMRFINKIAQKYNLIVIEDAAQALGSRNSDGYLGTQSDMGCFSFSVAKIISTGQGGFTVTRNEKIYRKLLAMRTQGVGDIVNAEWSMPGFNFRFTDILASIGIVQLSQLKTRIEKVKNIYQIYSQGIESLPFIKLIPVNLDTEEVPVYIEVLCKYRSRFIDFLESRSIQCRPFYPNLDQASYFNNFNKYPNSELFAEQGIYLPAGPEQPIENIYRVIEVIKEFGSLCA
jgi:dTDP-4-amino-4,6-dideoxygalactose transaminase